MRATEFHPPSPGELDADLELHIPVAPPAAVVREGVIHPVFDPRPWRWEVLERYLSRVRELTPDALARLREINGWVAGTVRGITLIADPESELAAGHLALQAWRFNDQIVGVQTAITRQGRVIRHQVLVPPDEPLRLQPIDHDRLKQAFNLLAPPYSSRDRGIDDASLVKGWESMVSELLLNLPDVSTPGKGNPQWDQIARRFIFPAGQRMERMSWRGYRDFLGMLDQDVLRKMRSMAAPNSAFYTTLTPPDPIQKKRRMQALEVFPLLMRHAFAGDGAMTPHAEVIVDVDRGRNPAVAYWEHRVDDAVDAVCPAWIKRRVQNLSFQRTGAPFARNPERMLELMHGAGPDRFPMARADFAFLEAVGGVYLDRRVNSGAAGVAGLRATLAKGYPDRANGERLLLARRIRAHMSDFRISLERIERSIEFHVRGPRPLLEPMFASVLDLPLEKIEALHAVEMRVRNQLPPGQGELKWPSLLRSPVTIENYQFTSLSSAADLAAEGTKHQHCVAGYVSSAMGGHSEILSAQSRSLARKDFTLEIGMGLDGRLIIRQARGRKNEEADRLGQLECESLTRRIERAVREQDGSWIDLARARHLYAPTRHRRIDETLTLEDLENWKAISPLTARMSVKELIQWATDMDPGDLVGQRGRNQAQNFRHQEPFLDQDIPFDDDDRQFQPFQPQRAMRPAPIFTAPEPDDFMF